MNIRFLIVLGPIIFTLLSCRSVPVREPANDNWKKQLQSEKFEVYKPAREQSELGNVISFRNGQDILVSTRDICLPELSQPKWTGVGILQTEDQVDSEYKVSSQLAEFYKNKIDLNFVASNENVEKANLKLVNPQWSRYQSIELKRVIENMDTNSDCYKAITNPNNLVVLTELRANGVEFSFTDVSQKKIQLSADILEQANVSPELKGTAQGKATLEINSPISIGYRAVAVRELPGAIVDKLRITDVPPKKLQQLRESSN